MTDNRHTDALRAHLESKHSAGPSGVPGLALFSELAMTHFQEPDRTPNKAELDNAIRGSENSLIAINSGLRGIGTMLQTLAMDTHPANVDASAPLGCLSIQTAEDIGGLIRELADAADSLSHVLPELRYTRDQLNR